MARRAIRVIDVVELFQHWHAGRRIGELSSSLGVDPKTVRKYIAPAIAAGHRPGRPAAQRRASGRRSSRAGSPSSWTDRSRQTTWPEIEPHHERINGLARRGAPSRTIHQRLRDDHGLAASESSLRRYIAANFDEEVGPGRRAGAARHPAARRRGTGGLRASWALVRPGERAAGAGCGASSWCSPSRGSCSCARCSRWTRRPGCESHVAGVRVLRRRGGTGRAGQLEDRGRSSPTSTTRSSTRPSASSPPTTAAWSTRPGS